jgi:hypothetical protein
MRIESLWKRVPRVVLWNFNLPSINTMFACGGEFDIGHDSEVFAGAIAMIRKADAGMRFFKGHQAVATA